MGGFWQWLQSFIGNNTVSAPTSSQPAFFPGGNPQVVVVVAGGCCCCSCKCGKKKPPGAPKGKFTVRHSKEIEDMLEYEIDLNSAPPVSGDVVKRHIFLTVGTAPQEEIIKNYPSEPTMTFLAERGDPVALYCRDEDADGNIGDPGELNAFIAADTIAPGAPGKFGVTLINDNATTTTTTPEPETTTTTTPAPEDGGE